MSFIKIGEAIRVLPSDVRNIDELRTDSDLDIENRMMKMAQTLKRIAPKADDFLYFTCVMMHAAEASLLEENGELKKLADGTPVSARWEPVGTESLKWVCNDPKIKPYKNNNNDIFREAALLDGFKKWVGRPLCVDHNSSSAEFFRGIIVDTYYDTKKKRVIALCALDRKLYPDLARKVSTGVSTDVSMGTAVGRAICFDCGKSARVEADFCSHMKLKTTYGEINEELSPIELSIVTNGADKRAKIKTIIAKDMSDVTEAAKVLQTYIDKKIATAADSSEIDEIKKQISELQDKLKGLEGDDGCGCGSCDCHSAIPGRSEETSVASGGDLGTDTVTLSGPEPVASYASDLQRLILCSRVKLASITDNLNELKEGTTMTTQKKAYYQGTEEPTPGKKQYPVDPGWQAREQDKTMVGKDPFPGVGPVDGMHTGKNTNGETDEQVKRRLQRMAEQEARSNLRKQALEKAKKAYFMGTVEPTKNTKVESYDAAARKTEEANNSPVADDTKERQQLQRAAMTARFRKAFDKSGSLDKAASAWNVFAGDKLILTASVKDIAGTNYDTLYSAVATQDFGRGILSKIKSEGFDKAKMSLIKSAQGAPPPPPPPPPGPEGAPPPPPPAGQEAEPMNEPGLDETDGGEVSPSDIAREIKNLATDISEKVEQLTEVSDTSKEDNEAIPGPEASPEEFEAAEAGPLPPKGASLTRMRKKLAGMIATDASEKIDTLKAHASELKLTMDVLKTKYAGLDKAQKAYFISLASSGIRDAKLSLAESNDTLLAYVKYAQGVNQMTKKAQMTFPPETIIGQAPKTQNADDYIFDEETIYSDKGSADDSEIVFPEGEVITPNNADDCANATVNVPDEAKLSDLPAGSVMASKASRAAYRAKLAQKGQKYSDMLAKAHPKGGVTIPGIKTTGDGAKIEDLEEVHDKMYQLSQASPKVKKQAKDIHDRVVAGEISSKDIDQLVSFGVDAAAVKYYRDMWGEAKDPEATEFARKLTEEHGAKKAAEDLKTKELKITRAYDLAYEMSDKGLISKDSIKKTAAEIQLWNDDSFNSVKAMVSTHEIRKVASVPQVGLLNSQDIIIPAKAETQTDLASFLSSRWEGKKM